MTSVTRDSSKVRVLPTVHGKAPPHDVDAEAGVISTLLLTGDRWWPEVGPILRPEDFHNPAHAAIYRAIIELHQVGSVVDILTVKAQLAHDDRLETSGGFAYLAEVTDKTPATQNVVTHARRVEECSRNRAMIATMQRLVAEGYTEPTSTFALDAARELSDVAGVERQRLGVINQAWTPMPISWLTETPDPQRYLICHPDKDGSACPPGEGDGMIPLGRAGMISSEGGAGKTMALIDLAISVITGRPWLGHFHPSWESRRGRVLLALAEEDAKECHRRLKRISDSLNLSDQERAKVADRLVVLPLAGKPVGLLQGGGFAPVTETRECQALRARLRAKPAANIPVEWSLVVIDPLARWSGVDCEENNTVATRFVQTIESLVEVPGNPTILVAHHSSKDARKNGKADSRGATALTDGFRWTATLTNKKEKGVVLFDQGKANNSRPMLNSLELLRGRYGILRVKSEADKARDREVETERLDARRERQEAHLERAIELMQDRMVQALRECMIKNTPVKRKQLRDICKGREATKLTALNRLLTDVRIIEKDGFLTLPEPGQ